VRDFAKMLTQLRGQDLPDWLARIDREGEPELKSIAIGVRRDLAAVMAGLTLPYSSGAVEGNVTASKPSNDKCAVAPSSTYSATDSPARLKPHSVNGSKDVCHSHFHGRGNKLSATLYPSMRAAG
jgi:hypothetical protein